MTNIQSIHALEILDSRANPTVSVNVTLNNRITASAGVPLFAYIRKQSSSSWAGRHGMAGRSPEGAGNEFGETSHRAGTSKFSSGGTKCGSKRLAHRLIRL